MALAPRALLDEPPDLRIFYTTRAQIIAQPIEVVALRRLARVRRGGRAVRLRISTIACARPFDDRPGGRKIQLAEKRLVFEILQVGIGEALFEAADLLQHAATQHERRWRRWAECSERRAQLEQCRRCV